MNKLNLLILLFSCSIYCQDIGFVKTLDTIFVNFKVEDSQKKLVFPINGKGFQEREYTFYLEFDLGRRQFLEFYFKEYLNSDRRAMDIRTDFRKVKKSYLRKNKKSIISIDFFKKYGVYRSNYEAFEKCKVIYIIDNSETKNGQIPIYEVTKWSSYAVGE